MEATIRTSIDIFYIKYIVPLIYMWGLWVALGVAWLQVIL